MAEAAQNGHKGDCEPMPVLAAEITVNAVTGDGTANRVDLPAGVGTYEDPVLTIGKRFGMNYGPGETSDEDIAAFTADGKAVASWNSKGFQVHGGFSMESALSHPLCEIPEGNSVIYTTRYERGLWFQDNSMSDPVNLLNMQPQDALGSPAAAASIIGLEGRFKKFCSGDGSVNVKCTPNHTMLDFVVNPSVISHNSLSGLSDGNPHNQYALRDSGEFTGDIMVDSTVFGESEITSTMGFATTCSGGPLSFLTIDNEIAIRSLIAPVQITAGTTAEIRGLNAVLEAINKKSRVEVNSEGEVNVAGSSLKITADAAELDFGSAGTIVKSTGAFEFVCSNTFKAQAIEYALLGTGEASIYVGGFEDDGLIEFRSGKIIKMRASNEISLESTKFVQKGVQNSESYSESYDVLTKDFSVIATQNLTLGASQRVSFVVGDQYFKFDSNDGVSSSVSGFNLFSTGPATIQSGLARVHIDTNSAFINYGTDGNRITVNSDGITFGGEHSGWKVPNTRGLPGTSLVMGENGVASWVATATTTSTTQWMEISNSAPEAPIAGQLYMDSNFNIPMIRNTDNSAWIEMIDVDAPSWGLITTQVETTQEFMQIYGKSYNDEKTPDGVFKVRFEGSVRDPTITTRFAIVEGQFYVHKTNSEIAATPVESSLKHANPDSPQFAGLQIRARTDGSELILEISVGENSDDLQIGLNVSDQRISN